MRLVAIKLIALKIQPLSLELPSVASKYCKLSSYFKFKISLQAKSSLQKIGTIGLPSLVQSETRELADTQHQR